MYSNCIVYSNCTVLVLFRQFFWILFVFIPTLYVSFVVVVVVVLLLWIWFSVYSTIIFFFSLVCFLSLCPWFTFLYTLLYTVVVYYGYSQLPQFLELLLVYTSECKRCFQGTFIWCTLGVQKVFSRHTTCEGVL